MSGDLIMLELKPTADLPRWLRLVLNPTTDYLSVVVCSPSDRHRHLGFAGAKRTAIHITSLDGTAYLFVGDAHFEVTMEQATEIQRTFSMGETA